MMPSHWTAAAVAAIDPATPTPPVIARDTLDHPAPDLDLWDYWPVQERDGTLATIAGGALFMFLSAPIAPDPEQRHATARIRTFHRTDGGWTDLGPTLPAELSPGSREWSGSAVVSPDHRTVSLYFTAAGQRGEPAPTFEQRLFETSARLDVVDGRPLLTDWSVPVECLVPDGLTYQRDMAGGGGLGTIKAFRDPAYFCDPRDGEEYLLFAASLAGSLSPWNGAVGLAWRGDERWMPLAPLIAAEGVNNELERPHIVVHAGRYYCFWSTQRKVFAAGGPDGPTGLYGMVADRLTGPWRPLNSSGLVFANPPAAPYQAYSWWVLPDLNVLGFADAIGAADLPTDSGEARRVFGGCPAPACRIALSGERAGLA